MFIFLRLKLFRYIYSAKDFTPFSFVITRFDSLTQTNDEILKKFFFKLQEKGKWEVTLALLEPQHVNLLVFASL